MAKVRNFPEDRPGHFWGQGSEQRGELSRSSSCGGASSDPDFRDLLSGGVAEVGSRFRPRDPALPGHDEKNSRRGSPAPRCRRNAHRPGRRDRFKAMIARFALRQQGEIAFCEVSVPGGEKGGSGGFSETPLFSKVPPPISGVAPRGAAEEGPADRG